MRFIKLIFLSCFFVPCIHPVHAKEFFEMRHLKRAQLTLDSLYSNYSAPDSVLLRETFPFNDQYSADYLASDEQRNRPNPYAYLWPYSGAFSAVNALLEATGDKQYKQLLDARILKGLEEYFDEKRTPYAYSSYLRSAPASDRFYDDNVWIGIDFTDLFLMTKSPVYLDKAKEVWKFIRSGTDEHLGGGIYWCEQKKESKNTCSNAPGTVLALKLFVATGDSAYFCQGKELYEWTKETLQDTTDNLYFDHIRLDGKIGKAKFAYNSGQMMQSAVLLYKLTNDPLYLEEARRVAKACYDRFFVDFKGKNGEQFRLISKGNVWFSAVMLRGFIELYKIDDDGSYIDAFTKSLDYAWQYSRDRNGLFNVDFSGVIQDDQKWLLTQAAMIEMFARMAALEK